MTMKVENLKVEWGRRKKSVVLSRTEMLFEGIKNIQNDGSIVQGFIRDELVSIGRLLNLYLEILSVFILDRVIITYIRIF